MVEATLVKTGNRVSVELREPDGTVAVGLAPAGWSGGLGEIIGNRQTTTFPLDFNDNQVAWLVENLEGVTFHEQGGRASKSDYAFRTR